MTVAQIAEKMGLEVIFSVNHQLHDRIFYDKKEGKYYDRYSDIYLEYEDAKAYGLAG